MHFHYSRRGVATDEYILQMQQHSSPRHPLSDVISATHVSSGAMITSQPMIAGAGGGISIGGSELKSRYYDEVSSIYDCPLSECVRVYLSYYLSYFFETLGVFFPDSFESTFVTEKITSFWI